MTTRSTTFADSASGQLEIVFRGAFSASVSGDAGFPMTGGANMVLECTVSDSGGQLAKTYVDRGSPSAHVVLSYPGGGVNWTASCTDVDWNYGGGLGGISMTPTVTFILVKR